MGGFAYYNEIDPFAVDWLRALIAAKAIPDGEVDPRSIALVAPADLHGFTQCHFFAGIGGWSYALQLAEWPEDRPVWTGSCPCQPFSSAGKGEGGRDPRHLWPEWFRLIKECRPATIFGEQVEAALGHGWLDLVYADLEDEDYAVGAGCLPAAGVGAPHIRGRVWFVGELGNAECQRAGRRTPHQDRSADAGSAPDRKLPSAVGSDGGDGQWLAKSHGGLQPEVRPRDEPRGEQQKRWRAAQRAGVGAAGGAGGQRLADPRQPRRQQDPRGASGHEAADGSAGRDRREPDGDYEPAGDGEGGEPRRLADRPRGGLGIDRGAPWHPGHADQREPSGDVGDSNGAGCEARHRQPFGVDAGSEEPAYSGFWRNAYWLPCLDGKSRPVEPGTQPMVDGLPQSLGPVRDSCIREVETAVRTYATSTQTDPGETVFHLWLSLAQEAVGWWHLGGLHGVWEAPVLLAFLRQLTAQGWAFSESVSRAGAQTQEVLVRGVWEPEAFGGTPRQRGLDGQPVREPSDALRVLSPLLARAAQAEWAEAFRANARPCFPLAKGVPNRVVRLRGYGNAIVPQVAEAFIRAYLAC